MTTLEILSSRDSGGERLGLSAHKRQYSVSNAEPLQYSFQIFFVLPVQHHVEDVSTFSATIDIMSRSWFEMVDKIPYS